MDKEFSEQARESLNAKMENYGGNRDAIMTDMKDKLKVCSDLNFTSFRFVFRLEYIEEIMLYNCNPSSADSIPRD